MGHIVECAQEDAQTRNTGASGQCLEGPVIKHVLSPIGQEFATAAAAKIEANWKTGIAAKELIPLFELEELAVADTEDTYFEGNSKYKTANGKKIRTFNLMLGVCSHAAVASYNGKQMRVYEFTDDSKLKAVTPDGTKVRGQLVTIEVGKRVDATKEKPAFTPVTLTYADYKEFESNPVILIPSWSHINLVGIFDVTVAQVSATASLVKFTVDAGCSGDPVTSLEDADITYTTALGVPVTHTFVAADANGVYSLTGTGFVSGNLLTLDGVVQKTEAAYEAENVLSIVVS